MAINSHSERSCNCFSSFGVRPRLPISDKSNARPRNSGFRECGSTYHKFTRKSTQYVTHQTARFSIGCLAIRS